MKAKAYLSRNESEAIVAFGGDWSVECPLDDRDGVLTDFENGGFQTVVFSGKSLGKWDSALIAFLLRLIQECAKRGISYTLTDMPDGVEPLIKLALSVPPRVKRANEKQRRPALDLLGEAGITAWNATKTALRFMLEAHRSFTRFVTGKAVLRKCDLLWEIQEAGVNYGLDRKYIHKR